MQCSHCFSLMENYRCEYNDKSLVTFYRCTLCQKEHVSSEQLTARRRIGHPPATTPFSPTPSHISPRP